MVFKSVTGIKQPPPNSWFHRNKSKEKKKDKLKTKKCEPEKNKKLVIPTQEELSEESIEEKLDDVPITAEEKVKNLKQIYIYETERQGILDKPTKYFFYTI